MPNVGLADHHLHRVAVVWVPGIKHEVGAEPLVMAVLGLSAADAVEVGLVERLTNDVAANRRSTRQVASAARPWSTFRGVSKSAPYRPFSGGIIGTRRSNMTL